MKANLMSSFPPGPESQVTLANWRKPPFNEWAFKHVRELVPSHEIANDPSNIRPAPSGGSDFTNFNIPSSQGDIPFQLWLETTDTDGIVILHGDKIVFEQYAPDMTPSTQHILMSVSKSVLGLLAGTLVDNGSLDVSRPVTDWIPEVSGSAYEGATVRDLLDMRAGVHFEENYLASSGTIIEYRKAQGWDPLESNDRPTDLRNFLATLKERDGEHAGRFHYISPNTDLLGWVIERASGTRYADLLSNNLWSKIGAERDAYITVDRLGAPRCAGGICATTRDLARIGLLMAEGGRSHGKQVVPREWINDILTSADLNAWDAGDFAEDFPGMTMHYRSQWYVLHGQVPLLFALGVFGQHLFVDIENRIIIAKFSSQSLPEDDEKTILTIHAAQAIQKQLSSHE